MILPPRLAPGDRVVVVSPSWGGASTLPWRYEAGKRQLVESLGVEVVEARHALASAEWIEANPQARADDLMEAFADPRNKMVIAAIGGDDAVQMIPFVDPRVFAAHPKILMGYSDTSVLHFGCYAAGLVSFYGPSVMAGFAENCGPFAYMVEHVKKAICSPLPIGEVDHARDGWTVEYLAWVHKENQARPRKLERATGPRLLRGEGVHRGHLLGGCADTLERIKQTAWWPPLDQWRGALLFYESSEEAPAPSVVAGWLADFAERGILQVLSGILFGRPGGRIDPKTHVDYDGAILRVLDDAGLPNLPVLSNLDFGHTDPMFTIPYGVAGEIDCDRVRLRITEPGVA